MTRTQFKDARKNVRKQIVSFLSIVLVVALGTGIFLVCRMGSLSTGNAGNTFYDRIRYHDLEIRATRGITREDVEAVKRFEGVIDAEGIIAADLIAESETGKSAVRAISQTQREDAVLLADGRLPERAGECAVTPELAASLGVAPGQTITVSRESGGVTFLKTGTYTVTGIMIHPDKIRKNEMSVSNLLLTVDSFDTEAIGVPFTGILVRVNADSDAFSDRYAEQIGSYLNALTLFGKERAVLRDAEILADAEKKIGEGETTLETARAELDEAREKAADGDAVLFDAERQLQTARITLDLSKQQLLSSKTEIDNGKEKLAKAKAELEKAKTELDGGRAQLDAAKAELEKAAAEIEENEKKLKEGEKELRKGEQELEEARVRLSVAQAVIDEAERSIDTNRRLFSAVLTDLWPDLKDQITENLIPIRELSQNFTLQAEDLIRSVAEQNGFSAALIEATLSQLEKSETWRQVKSLYDRLLEGVDQLGNASAQYEEGLAEWEKGREEYERGAALLEQGKAEYRDGYALYLAKESEYASASLLYQANLSSYESGLAEYEEGLARYTDAEKQLADGEKELAEKTKEWEEGKEQLADGKALLAEKEAEYEKGAAEIARARAILSDTQGGKWIVLPRSLNLSFHEMQDTVSMFSNIGISFAVLFVLLGALVCYATIGKIIDEQRRLVGATKALGFKRSEIFSKYLLFGGSASALGAVAGILIAYFVLQPIMVGSMEESFSIGEFRFVFEPVPSILAILIAVSVGILATHTACGKLLKKPAVKLLNGEVKGANNKEQRREDGVKTKSLYAGLIFKNIRGDLKRVAITVASIAGCCMLLIIGFSLKFSFLGVTENQFGQILRYNSTVSFLPEESGQAEEAIAAAIDRSAEAKLPMYVTGTVMRIGDSFETVQLFCADPDELIHFCSLYDVTKKQTARIPDGGVIIFNRLAEIYRLSIGDHLSILDASGAYHDVPVSGIYDNYFGRNVYLSADYARELFGDAYGINTFAVKHKDENESALRADLLKEKSFIQLTTKAELTEKVNVASRSMNTVILVMITMSAIMAAVVLLNLVKIQINQKKRELTVMRINGFTIRETVNYILRENVITAFFGIVSGLVIGNAAARYTLSTVERVELRMIRQISVPSCLFSVLITLSFAAVVNWIALRSIRRLSLTRLD